MKKLLFIFFISIFSVCETTYAFNSVTANIQRLVNTCACPHCDLRYANLENFRPAENQKFKPYFSKLGQYMLKTCDLTNANLAYANMKNTNFSGNVIRAVTAKNSTGESVLKTSIFNAANLEHANLENAMLIGNTFYKANLKYVNLQKADLFRAEFQGANLQYADLSNASAHLDAMNGFGAYMNGVDFSYANLSNANLAAYFHGSNFSYANLQNAKLIESDSPQGDSWRNVNFAYANLKGACLGYKLCRTLSSPQPGIAENVLRQALFCHTIMPDGSINNRDCGKII